MTITVTKHTGKPQSLLLVVSLLVKLNSIKTAWMWDIWLSHNVSNSNILLTAYGTALFLDMWD